MACITYIVFTILHLLTFSGRYIYIFKHIAMFHMPIYVKVVALILSRCYVYPRADSHGIMIGSTMFVILLSLDSFLSLEVLVEEKLHFEMCPQSLLIRKFCNPYEERYSSLFPGALAHHIFQIIQLAGRSATRSNTISFDIQRSCIHTAIDLKFPNISTDDKWQCEVSTHALDTWQLPWYAW